MTVLAAAAAQAHPVPRSSHDRTISVHVRPVKDDRFELLVKYRLEVDELTVVLEDMAPYRDEVDFKDYRKKPLEYYGRFASIYAPLLAERLSARVEGRDLAFVCLSYEPQLRDEKGEALGHLRCDFSFRAEFRCGPAPTHVEFEDDTYLMQSGEVRLSLVNDTRHAIESLQAMERSLRFVLDARALGDGDLAMPAPQGEPAPGDNTLLRVARSSHELWWVLILAFWFGAAHALTPGHGKSLVAAYLVGQRGTIWHALTLGLITTLTHTGAVLLIAFVLLIHPALRAFVQGGLVLVVGLSIVLLGFYLLIQRLAGRADHVHVGGGHHHGPAGHAHGPTLPDGVGVPWWNLLVLGVAGGIVPCWDAVALLLFMVGSDQQERALPVLLVFSLGLATVLVAIGIAVVKLRGFAGSTFGEGKWTWWLSLVSAVAISGMGLFLCMQAVR
jgi:ABC-type nickel/cobalt efflux system permease component RcnA